MVDRALPEGTVTFLFTDIEGSTRLQARAVEDYPRLLEEHRVIVRDAIARHDGHEMGTEGDSFFVAFAAASDAVAAAFDAQRALTHHEWGTENTLKVRMGLHSGDARIVKGNYVGLAIVEAHRVSTLASGGQVLIGYTTKELARNALPADVGLMDLGEHLLKSFDAPYRIFQVTHPDLVAEFPPLRSEPAPGNIPVPLTSFIGREVELQAVHDLLDTHRLITLVGPGGSGKTRCAIEVAQRSVTRFLGGAWIVELSGLQDGSLVAAEVALATGIPEIPGRTIVDALRDALKGNRALILLDNCEHLVADVAVFVSDLLSTLPDLRILATSREPLGVSGESVYRLPSLPDPDALALFGERATLAKPGFEIAAADADAASRIVVMLDGIPLAIELAAARVSVLSVREIAERLGDRFRLLTTGARTAEPRQQTLRGAVDWSFELLSPAEQALFVPLSVFAGTFSIDAVEAICMPPAPEVDALDLVAQLVAKSLVVTEERDGHTRFRLLQTLRQYAAERLSGSEGENVYRARHFDWFSSLAARATKELGGSAQAEWLEQLALEHDDLRAALEWGSSNEIARALDLAVTLIGFWQTRGHWAEGRVLLNSLLSVADGAAPGRAYALAGSSTFARYQGDLDHAHAASEEALDLFEKAGDLKGAGATLNQLGAIAHARGELERARDLFERSLDMRRAIGDQRALSETLNNLGAVAKGLGDVPAARARFEEFLALARERDDARLISAGLNNLGALANDDGAFDVARGLFEESLEIRRRLGDRAGIAECLANLGWGALEQADAARAKDWFEESLEIDRELGNRVGVALTLSDLGRCLIALGESDRAVTVLGEAIPSLVHMNDVDGVAVSLEALGSALAALGVHEEAVASWACAAKVRGADATPGARADTVRGPLDDVAFRSAWERGLALDPAEAGKLFCEVAR